ncbi:MAG TPA: 3-hydroxybutyryl-CoA dehydrogenase [Actinomycetota bacterium]|nr:3-hydroxybutyryl-CoA dehydrogenase [Actinomycetota bacterium]
MKADEVQRVAVVGSGVMGSGIAEVCARAGLDVIVLETTVELLSKGRERIERSTEAAVERGRLDAGERQAALLRVVGTTRLEELAAADLVLEAATEDVAIKRELFARLDAVMRDDVVFGSNTSSIPIGTLGAATTRPDRVVGMHWFNPVPVMGLVEIVPALTTSEETVAFARAFGERMGKRTVLSGDRAGFIVNTLLIPYLNDAIRMLEERFATADDIDTAVHLGLNHPMGPLRLADLIGLDTCLNIAEVLYEEFRDPKFAPPPVLRRMVTAGRLGKKTGSGFYDDYR